MAVASRVVARPAAAPCIYPDGRRRFQQCRHRQAIPLRSDQLQRVMTSRPLRPSQNRRDPPHLICHMGKHGRLLSYIVRSVERRASFRLPSGSFRHCVDPRLVFTERRVRLSRSARKDRHGKFLECAVDADIPPYQHALVGRRDVVMLLAFVTPRGGSMRRNKAAGVWARSAPET